MFALLLSGQMVLTSSVERTRIVLCVELTHMTRYQLHILALGVYDAVGAK